MKKATKNDIYHMSCIRRLGYVINTGDWTEGAGRYVRARKIPPFCTKVTITEALNFGGIVAKNAAKLLRERPRIRFVIACYDVRKFNRMFGEAS